MMNCKCPKQGSGWAAQCQGQKRGLHTFRSWDKDNKIHSQKRVRKTNELSDRACPRCLKLAKEGKIRIETVQRIPSCAPPRDINLEAQCWDCASAGTVIKVQRWPNDEDNFLMARIAVGNDRQEQYRLPGASIGLVQMNLMRPSRPGDLEDQYAWLERNKWFNLREES